MREPQEGREVANTSREAAKKNHFSFSSLCDSCSPLCGPFAALSCGDKIKNTSGTRVQTIHLALKFQSIYFLFAILKQ